MKEVKTCATAFLTYSLSRGSRITLTVLSGRAARVKFGISGNDNVVWLLTSLVQRFSLDSQASYRTKGGSEINSARTRMVPEALCNSAKTGISTVDHFLIPAAM